MSDTDQGVHAYRGHTQAMAFARKGGAELDKLLFNIAWTKQEESKGPVATMVFLNENFSFEDIPVVGSKKGETGNKPYDKYTTEVTTSEGKRNVPGSFYTDVVKSTDTWLELHTRREHVKQAQGEGVPADIIAMKPGDRALEKKRIDKFITNMRTALTKGSMLLHQWEAIKAMNPDRVKVVMPVMTQKNDKGEPISVVTGSLIKVFDPTASSDDEPEALTVAQFLAWDADKAAKDPDKGTIASLKATATRTPGGKGKNKAGAGTAYVAARTIGDLLTLFNVLATSLDNGTDEGRKMESQLLTACAKEGKDGDEAVMSTGHVCMAADNIWNVIQNRYNNLTARKAAALNTKTAA